MTPERRRDRYGPARARPSLWAGHKAAEAKLLASGHAYRDFARPEEFDEERKAAQVAGKPYLSSRRFAAFDDETARRFEAEGRQSVVRLKMPRDGALVIDDKVRGRVKFAWEREQDHVIQRVDGSCLYHLASVVDDHGLAMTHVIRAEEHLSNTPRQAFIALSLGYELPTYAHLPLVAEPGSRTKLSKRKLAQYLKNADFKQVMDHGMKIADRVGLKAEADTLNPVIVDFYSEVGYLPWAIDNYLPLLGWSYDDKTEFFSHDDLIQHFTLERIHSSPASFDSKKLWAVQDHSMGERSTDEKLALMLPFLVKAKLVSDPPAAAAVTMVRKVIEAALKQAVQAAGVKVSDLVHAVRVAMTGKTVGPGLYDCLAILGREQSLSRIARALPMCG